MKVILILKSDYKSDNESKNENKKDENYYEIKQLNDWFKTIDQTKSLEEQIELLKEKGEFLSEYWYAHKRDDLIDAVKIILEINELLKSDKVNND